MIKKQSTNSFKLILLSVLFLACFFNLYSNNSAFADQSTNSDTAYQNICNSNSVSNIVKEVSGCNDKNSKAAKSSVTNILIAIISISGLVAVVFVLIGGIKYMTSTGDPGKVEKARKTIVYATIGIAVCSLAFAIVNWTIGVINGDSNSLEEKPSTPDPQPEAPKDSEKTKDKPDSDQIITPDEPEDEPEDKTEDEPEDEPEDESQENPPTIVPDNKTENPEQTNKEDESPNTNPPETQKAKPESPSKDQSTPTPSQPTTSVSTRLNNAIKKLAWSYKDRKKASTEPTKAYAKAVVSTKITSDLEDWSPPPKKNHIECLEKGQSCGMFVGTVYRYSKVDTKMPSSSKRIYNHVKNNSDYKLVKKNFQAGDIILFFKKDGDQPKKNPMHVEIILELKDGLYTAKGDVCKSYGRVYRKGVPVGKKTILKIYRHK